MSITLTVKELKDALNLIKPLNTKNTRLIMSPSYQSKTLSLCAAQSTMILVTEIQNINGLDQENFPFGISIDLKAFNDLIGLCGNEGDVTLNVKINENYINLEVELNTFNFVLRHELPGYNQSTLKRNILDTICVKDTSEYNKMDRDDFVQNLQKCILSDSPQVIMSAQAHAYTASNGQFVVYINDKELATSAVLNTTDTKIIYNVLKSVKDDTVSITTDEEKHLLFIRTENVFMQICQTMPRKSLLNQINGLNMADYSEHHTVINKKYLENAVKAITTLSQDMTATMKIAENKLLLGEKICTNVNQIDDTSEIAISINIDMLKQMLKCLDTENIHISFSVIAQTEEQTGDEAQNQKLNTNRLMRLSEYNNDNTLGTRTYCLV